MGWLRKKGRVTTWDGDLVKKNNIRKEGRELQVSLGRAGVCEAGNQCLNFSLGRGLVVNRKNGLISYRRKSFKKKWLNDMIIEVINCKGKHTGLKVGVVVL